MSVQPSQSAPDPEDDLSNAIEMVKTAVGNGRARNYPGSGGIWLPYNDGIADGNFTDWALGRAVAEIFNAIKDERLVRKAQLCP